MGLDVTNVAASLAMPAESTNPTADNKPNQFAAATSAAVQAAAQQVLQNRVAEAQQVTGVTLPSFYNPAAVNPMKYAQQIQKRKLLWSNKVNSFRFIFPASCILIIPDGFISNSCSTYRRKMSRPPHLLPNFGKQRPSRKTKTEK